MGNSHQKPAGWDLDHPQDDRVRSRPALSQPILEVADLRAGFQNGGGYVPILNGIELTMRPGEIVGLVGASGSGKSLLAKTIIRLEKPARIMSGSIRLAGSDIARSSPRSVRSIRGRLITYVPQDPLNAMDPVYSIRFQFQEILKRHMTGNGDGNGNSSPKSRLSATILKWMKRVDISAAETRINQYPHQWSRGMLQRALLAMSFSTSPRIIILDEVTSALDPTITLQIISLIAALRDRHQTAVLLITHDLAIAHEICDSIAVIHQGVIVEAGKAQDIFHHPRHGYTRQLLSNMEF